MIASARTEAIQIAREKLALHPIYLDTETTGNGPGDEIIQIGILDDEGQVVFDSLVKPSTKIQPEAQRVHGLDEGKLANALRRYTIWPKVETILAGKTIGIYNADFDLRMIQQTNQKYRIRWSSEGVSVFCIMKLYAQYYGEWNRKTGWYRYQSLEMAGSQCRISLQNLHQACDDALLARAVLLHMAQG